MKQPVSEIFKPELSQFQIITDSNTNIIAYSAESTLAGKLGLASDIKQGTIDDFIAQANFLDDSAKKELLSAYASVASGEEKELTYAGDVVVNHHLMHLHYFVQLLNNGDISVSFYDLTDVTKERDMMINVLGVVAHEVRNPLVSIGGFANWIQKNSNDPAVKKFAGIITQETSRLEGILDRYTSFHRIKKGRLDAKIEETSLYNDVIEPALELTAPERERKKMWVDHPRSMATEVRLQTDKELLKQVYLILLSNAIKYGKTGGRITYGIEDTGKEYKLIVWNEGVGIPQNEIDNLFQQFYRVKRPEQEVKGVGIGLWLAKKIVEEALGGKMLRPESDGCSYAKFSFTIPKQYNQPL